MIDIFGSDKTPQHLPIGSLKLFGTNPYGDPIFRVVWSESRYYLVGGKHVVYDDSAGGYSNDDVVNARGKDPNVQKAEVCYKWLPLYPSVHAWILERWMSPQAFTGMGPDQWRIQYLDKETGLLTLGPYPDRGEYAQCFTFPSTPDRSAVDLIIGRVKAGWNYKYADHLRALKEAEELKEKEKKSRFEARFKDSQQAFNNKPTNIRPGKRTADKIPLRYTAEEVGLVPSPFLTGNPRRRHARNNSPKRTSHR